MMSHPVVTVAAGLYYFLGSILLFKKLVGSEENDWLLPITRDRPRIDVDTGFGLLGFSAGLYNLQKIPDSNVSKPEDDAWTLKLPWEVHLRRKKTPEELYDPMNAYWTNEQPGFGSAFARLLRGSRRRLAKPWSFPTSLTIIDRLPSSGTRLLRSRESGWT
jgi:hypothetical protein